jgi:hypothetical protein
MPCESTKRVSGSICGRRAANGTTASPDAHLASPAAAVLGVQGSRIEKCPVTALHVAQSQSS